MSRGSTIYYGEEYTIKEQDKEYLKKRAAESERRRQFYQRCPICNVYEPIITNVHCLQNHGMTKKEVEQNYSKITSDVELNKLANRRK